MSNQKIDQPHTSLGNRLLEALTQTEIAALLEAVLATLTPDRQQAILEQLGPDTRQTVRQLLAPPPTAGEAESLPEQPVSTAKLQQHWQELWREWDAIVTEAGDEEGDYLAQEAHWEAPYFDQYAFVQDLEKVAERMEPLIPSAVEHRFVPDMGFAEAISQAEDTIAAGMPEWIYLDEGFVLEATLTDCLLTWEWLNFREEGLSAFAFAQFILEWEDTFVYASLDNQTLLEFFMELPEADQKEIFAGLSEHRETPPWKAYLDRVFDPWHLLYMYYVEQFAPERYLDNLHATIPQRWSNGLPVIEALLEDQDYEAALAVLQETLGAMLEQERIGEAWTPETSLLGTLLPHYTGDTARLQSHQKLLTYYRQVSQALGQKERANALSLQLAAFKQLYNWPAMLEALATTPLSDQIRSALFISWRDHIVQRAKPSTWEWGQPQAEPRDTWWLAWLLDSIVAEKKGPAWFQSQVADWLAQLPATKRTLGEDYGFLRLLTHDLGEIEGRVKERYPHFFEVVIRPGELKSSDQDSRRAYLQQHAADDLLDRVITYWQAHLKNFVPKPENVRKADYTHHAQWMAALRELAPDDYKTLRHQWQVDHHRRRNLWKAMTKVGLM